MEIKAPDLERGVNAISLFSAVKKASPEMHNLKELRWNRTGAYNDNLLPAFFSNERAKLQHLEIKGSDSWWPEESRNLWQLCPPSDAAFMAEEPGGHLSRSSWHQYAHFEGIAGQAHLAPGPVRLW